MDWFVGLKFIHVLSVITAVGSNLTYTYWLRRAGTDRDRLVWTITGIQRLDNLATPAYVVVLVTGVLMTVADRVARGVEEKGGREYDCPALVRGLLEARARGCAPGRPPSSLRRASHWSTSSSPSRAERVVALPSAGATPAQGRTGHGRGA